LTTAPGGQRSCYATAQSLGWIRHWMCDPLDIYGEGNSTLS